jgi:DNA polymerase-3 subunit epsilon
MREIVLDTETTGLDPKSGHRVVEIACLELVNYVPTGRTFHKYCNPERDMPEEAFNVHGLSISFLEKHPTFEAIVDEFLEFVGDARLIIHNADFDMRFLNAELIRANRAPLPAEQATCTMIMARKRFPGAQASLDALCKRFAVDNSHRTKHGALLDSELLAEVYLELMGGRQAGLALAAKATVAETVVATEKVAREARVHGPSEEELAAHAAMLAKLKNPIWLN